MGRIAILGTEGTGKTVLMTVLARLHVQEKAGLTLLPRSLHTAHFVDSVWDELRNGEWPKSTESNTMDLTWDVRVNGATHSTLEFRDIRGQDFRELFGNEEIDGTEPLEPLKQSLVDYLESADVVALLVNLSDFTREPTAESRVKSQWALKKSLDWLLHRPNPKKCAIIFSKADQYAGVSKQAGGWMNLAREHLPYVYEAHLRHGQVVVHAVAAVANTEPSIDQGIRVPKRNEDVQSRGLNTLMNWIRQAAEEEPIVEAEVIPDLPPPVPDEPVALSEAAPGVVKSEPTVDPTNVVIFIAAGIVLLAALFLFAFLVSQ